MKPLKNFEDLHCWKLAVELCELVYDLCEKAGLPADDELACRWYVASMNVSGKIAFSYGPENMERFQKWIPLSKKYCMETVLWAGIAMKKNHINEYELHKVTALSKKITKKIDAIIKYLETYGDKENMQWNVFFKEGKE